MLGYQLLPFRQDYIYQDFSNPSTGHRQLANLLEQFLNQVDVGHDHAPAAVAFTAEFIHSVSDHG